MAIRDNGDRIDKIPSNSTHKDDCDILKAKCKDHFDHKCKGNKYMEEFISMLGSGMPTTCQYKHVWESAHLQNICEVHGFIMTN